MFFNEEVGWKYKMSAMQAALGLAQLERVDELVEGKRRIFGWYRDALSDWNGGALNPDITGLHNSYWMSTIVLEPSLGTTKEALIPQLKEKGIDARPFFYPLSQLPAFRDTAEGARAHARNVNANAITPYGINLPSALNLTQEDVMKVAATVKRLTKPAG
jgi:perosamine synthetase